MKLNINGFIDYSFKSYGTFTVQIDDISVGFNQNTLLIFTR